METSVMASRDITHERILQQAKYAGMTLDSQHWEVINFVLDVYDGCDECRNARQMMKKMDQQFSAEGGKKYLYKLFPEGPVRQVHKLADLPSLHHQVDQGFGTSY